MKGGVNLLPKVSGLSFEINWMKKEWLYTHNFSNLVRIFNSIGHSAVYYEGHIYLFGWLNAHNEMAYNTMLDLDLEKKEVQIIEKDEKTPSPRNAHSCILVVIRNEIL